MGGIEPTDAPKSSNWQGSQQNAGTAGEGGELLSSATHCSAESFGNQQWSGMVRCSFGPSTQTCLRSRRVVVVCHAEAFSDWRCMAVSFPGSGQQACLSEQKACGGLPRCSRVVLSGMHARFRARLVLAMLHNACAAGGFTATLGSGTSGDTRVGGVSDLTSQEGNDKSVSQRAKEGVQGLTGQQSQHCLCKLAAWPSAAGPAWPLCVAKLDCLCLHVPLCNRGRQHCPMWLTTDRLQSMPSNCRGRWR